MQLVLDTDHDYTRGAFVKGLRNKVAHANGGSGVFFIYGQRAI
jgi:hypothetical protein